VHSFAVWQQDNAQVPTVHLLDWRPTPDATVFLNGFFHGIVYDLLNPFQLDSCPIRPLAHRFKIARELHGSNLSNIPQFERRNNKGRPKTALVNLSQTCAV